MEVFKINNAKFKNIVKVLEDYRFKISELLPEDLKLQFEEESYIAGGSIYSMYHDNNFKDVDIFIKSDDLKNKILKYFKSISNKIALFEGVRCWKGNIKDKKFILTKNALSIENIQIIIKDVGEPKEVVCKFDFEHNMCYIESNKIKTLVNLSAFYNKLLIYNKRRARDVVGVIIRTQKYINRGMTFETKELAKMLLDLNKVGFSEEELKMLNSKITNQSFGS